MPHKFPVIVIAIIVFISTIIIINACKYYCFCILMVLNIFIFLLLDSLLFVCLHYMLHLWSVSSLNSENCAMNLFCFFICFSPSNLRVHVSSILSILSVTLWVL